MRWVGATDSHPAGRRLRAVLVLVAVLAASTEAHALLCQSNSATNWDVAGTWSCARVPLAIDDVEIRNGDDVTIPAGFAAVAQKVTILSNNGTGLIIHAASTSTLTVGAGGVTINAPSNNNTNVWRINAGSATVNGPVTLNEGSNNSRISSIELTSGTLVINGNLAMNNANNNVRTLISATGAANISLTGSFTLAGGFGTLTPATSTFNFNGSAAAQTIPIGVASIQYNNLHVNNTHASGATLSAAISVVNVAGNLRVQTGTLNNGGFAIVGAAAATFEVVNGARFNLSGTSAMASGYGTRLFGATSTVNYQGGNQTVAAETYGHLILDGGSTKTPVAGNTAVAGNFTLGAATTFAGTTNDYGLAGNFTNSGTFTSGTGTYAFNGASGVTPQTLTGATTFTNLRVINTGIGLRLASDITVSTAAAGGLILTDGNVDTQAFSLIIARDCNVSATVPVNRSAGTAGWIIGNLRKTYPTGTPVTCSFEVGDAANYTPITSLTISSVATAGTLTARTTAGDHADTTANTSGIDVGNSVNRTWTLTSGGTLTFAAGGSYSATFNFINATPVDLDTGGTPLSFVVARKASGEWTYPNTSSATVTTTTATGIPQVGGFGEFAVGAPKLLGALGEWRMDDTTWIDSSGNGYNGTGAGLSGGVPTGSSASPAIAGSPGTCAYAVFNRTNKTYIGLPGSFPNLGASNGFTITAWIRTIDRTQPGQRIFIDDEGITGGGYGLSLSDGGTGMVRFFSRGTPSALTLDTPNVIADNTWYFVAAVADIKSRRKTIYVYDTAGNPLAGTPVSVSWTEASFGSDTGIASIGGETNSPPNVGEGTSSFGFAGNIDEVRVFQSAYSREHVNLVRQLTRPCALADHLSITGNSTGITCAPEDIVFTAHNSTHNPVAVTGTLNVSTSSARGDWTSVSGGSGFSNGAADDGQASILFSNESSVTLRLTHTYTGTSNINASLAGITETSGSAASAEDLSIAWASAGFKFFQDTTTTPATIGTQIAGKASNLAPGLQTLFLRAIKTDNTGACAGLFANPSTVNVDMASQCNDPVTCSSQKVTINSTQIASNPNSAVSSYTSVPLAFGSNSQAPVIVNSADAGRMTLFARYTLSPSGELIAGPSNAFVVRPFAFRVSGTGLPGVTGPGGAVFKRAGEDFPVTVTAVAWEAADDANADGIPDSGADLSANATTLNFGQESSAAGATVTHTLLQPAGGSSGTLTGGAYAGFASGAKTQNLNWSEVGSISLSAALTGGNYLASSQTVTGTVNPVGRFRPDHFILTPGSLANRRLLGCASNFSHLDEQMRVTFTLTARNALASPTTTTNYATANSFAKLDGTDIARFGFGAVDLADGTPPIGRSALTSRIATGTSSGTWVAGVGSFTADFAVSRAATPDGPFESVQLGALPAEPLAADGVTLRTADLNLDTSSPADTNDRVLLGSTKLRFGRLRLQNALGSEKLDLPIPIETQYWNGSAFIRNADDACTTIVASDIVLSDPRVNLGLAETSVKEATVVFGVGGLSGGTGKLTLSAPGAGNNGSLLLTPTLGVNRPYLQGAWTGAIWNQNPSARATFGLFGSQPQNFIFQRENY